MSTDWISTSSWISFFPIKVSISLNAKWRAAFGILSLVDVALACHKMNNGYIMVTSVKWNQTNLHSHVHICHKPAHGYVVPACFTFYGCNCQWSVNRISFLFLWMSSNWSWKKKHAPKSNVKSNSFASGVLIYEIYAAQPVKNGLPSPFTMQSIL